MTVPINRVINCAVLAAPFRRHASRIARRQRAQTDGMHVQLRSDFGQVDRLEWFAICFIYIFGR
jgi:hypothetical protein